MGFYKTFPLTLQTLQLVGVYYLNRVRRRTGRRGNESKRSCENDAKVMISSSSSSCLSWPEGTGWGFQRAGRQSQAENLTASGAEEGESESKGKERKALKGSAAYFIQNEILFPFYMESLIQAEGEVVAAVGAAPGEAARRCSNFDKARQIVETPQTARCHKLLPCNQRQQSNQPWRPAEH